MSRPKGSKNKNLVPVDVRFWDKVNKHSDKECWEWTAFIHPSGYGTFRLRGKEILSHRMAWTLAHGKIPDGLCVCHKCDNRICCNPKHLFLGTYEDNAHDRDMKKRTVVPDNRGSKHGMSKLSESDVKEIKKLLSAGVMTKIQIAEKFGVARQTISGIGLGNRWGWLE